MTDEAGTPDGDERRLTDDAILTTRRDALRRIGQAAAAVALGGLATACGNGEGGASSTTAGTTPVTAPNVAGATLRRPEYSGSGRAGSDTDVSRTADPKGDSDVSTTGDPPADTDITTYGDAPGTGTDSDPFDPVGGGTDSDSDITVYGDPAADTDVSTTADPKGDADVTTTADPVS